ncbi:MAG TPA: YvcK family protein [Actinobacteria bacterium]|nr:YvcK family protein [Actinomycetota bacterium]
MKSSKKGREVSAVAIGGGTGIPNVLKSLKNFTSDINAIVTVADDGGSSGRIRRELKILPPGDIRNCLMALADPEAIMRDIFQYRFKDGELAGHCLGNLILAALADMKGDFVDALSELCRFLNVKGKVLPSTLENVILHAQTKNGELIYGQSEITGSHTRGDIEIVHIEPRDALAYPEAVEAIKAADQIIIGPGSLFTSIIPNLLIKGIQEALCESNGLKVFICNMVTQPGETEGRSVIDHLEAVLRHVPQNFLDVIIVNSNTDQLTRKAMVPVKMDKELFVKYDIDFVLEDVADVDFAGHHDPLKLGQVLRDLV